MLRRGLLEKVQIMHYVICQRLEDPKKYVGKVHVHIQACWLGSSVFSLALLRISHIASRMSLVP